MLHVQWFQTLLISCTNTVGRPVLKAFLKPQDVWGPFPDWRQGGGCIFKQHLYYFIFYLDCKITLPTN